MGQKNEGPQSYEKASFVVSEWVGDVLILGNT